MQVRNFSPHTQASYVQQVSLFARWPEKAGSTRHSAWRYAKSRPDPGWRRYFGSGSQKNRAATQPLRLAAIGALTLKRTPEPELSYREKSFLILYGGDLDFAKVCQGSKTARIELLSGNTEIFKATFSKRHGDWNVRGVTSACNRNAANPATIMPRVKGMPMTAYVCFEPGAKINGIRRRGNANVAKIPRDIAGWDIHAAAQSNS
jgi:hypothetical protein